MLAGALEIQMTADIARIRKDMSDAKSVVTSTMDGIEKAAGVATKALGFLGVGLSVNYFKNFIAGAINAQDKLLEMSQKVGVSVEMLAGLEHAAGMSGVSLDGVQKALKSVSTQLFEAGKGMKSSQENFAALGISIHDTEGNLKSADAVMVEVSDRFKQMEDGTNKTALATKLFGRAGLDLIPMLNEGSAGLAALIEEGQRYNPVTEESARQADEFNDNIDRLMATVKSFGLVMVNNILPTLSEWSQAVLEFTQNGKLAEWFDKVKTAAELLAAVFIARMTPAIVASGLAFIAATAESIAYQAALARMAGVSNTAAIAQGALATATGLFNGALAIIGGPAGAAILAAYGIYKIVEALGEANTKFIESQRAMREWVSAGATVVSMQDRIAAGQKLVAEANAEEAGAIGEAVSVVHDLFRANGMVIPQTKQIAKVVEQATDKTFVFNGAVKTEAELLEEAEAELKLFNASIDEYIVEQERAKEANDKQRQSIADTIRSLQEQSNALDMTARMATVYQAINQAIADGALPDEIAQIATATAALYDKAEALRVAGDAAVGSSKAGGDAAVSSSRRVEEQYGRTHEFLTNTLMEFGESGQSVWKDLGDTAVTTIKRIAAEMLASGIMNLFGIGGGGGSGTLASFAGSLGGGGGGGGGLSTVASLASLGGSAGVGGFVSGLTGTGAAAASFMGPPTAAAATGASLAAFATNPVTLAVAALMIAAKNDFWKDPDNYQRSYAGLLTAPTPGAAGSTFDVAPFASGFSPLGIAHNASRQAAEEQIDVFRNLDSSITGLVTKLGGTVNMSRATLAGVGKEGIYGTAGTLLGIGGKTGVEDIAQMVDSYATQMGLHIEGLDKDLMRSVKSAGSAAEAVRILTDALVEQDKALTGAGETAQTAITQTANYSNASLFSNPSFGGGFDFERLARVEGLGSDGAPLEGWEERRRRNMEADRLAGIPEAGGIIAALSNAVSARLSPESFIDGSHAMGLDYVPFDGYVAELHRGERVVPASENRASNDMIGTLVSELSAMRAELSSIRKSVAGSYDIVDKWDGEGMPDVRAA